MARITEDRVMETTTTTGTGALTLAGAVTGYQAFSARMTSPSDTCYYYIEGVDGSGIPTGEWETGLGTYSGANTLTRTTVIRSSNSDAAVNLSAGTKRVAIAAIARQLSFRGALVKKSGNQTGADYSAGANIAWDAETYDTDAIHDTVTNNSRLTVPAGVSYVRLSAAVRINNLTADLYAQLLILKAAAAFDGIAQTASEIGTTTTYLSTTTAVIPVSAGDYFEAKLQVETDTSIDIVAAQSWFAMEIIA